MVPLMKPLEVWRLQALSAEVLGKPQTPEHLHFAWKGLEAALNPQVRQHRGSGTRELWSSEGRRKEAKGSLRHYWSSGMLSLAATVPLSGKTKAPIPPSRVTKKKIPTCSGPLQTPIPCQFSARSTVWENCPAAIPWQEATATNPAARSFPSAPKGLEAPSSWARQRPSPRNSNAPTESSPGIPGPGKELRQPRRRAGPAAGPAGQGVCCERSTGGTVPQPRQRGTAGTAPGPCRHSLQVCRQVLAQGPPLCRPGQPR